MLSPRKYRSGNPIDPARLHEALVYSAHMVEQYGPQYIWIFERLEQEWEALQQQDVAVTPASKILDRHGRPPKRE